MDKNIAILVNTCDAYSDAWTPFFTLFQHYFPDCPYKIWLNTEHKQYSIAGLKIECINIQTEKEYSYSHRFIDALNKIDNQYVLILLEDFFIRTLVDIRQIEQCRRWMDENRDIALFSFESVEDKNNIFDERYPRFVQRPHYGDYKMNLQAGLWRKSYLLDLLREGETPWEVEDWGNIRTFSRNYKFYVLAEESERVFDYRVNNGEYPYKWGIYRGKWVLDTVESLFSENGIDVDYKQRGIYFEEKDSVVSEDKVNTRIPVRAIGLKMYIKLYYWGYYRKIVKLLTGRELPGNYIEYIKSTLSEG